MLEFKSLELCDMEIIRPYFKNDAVICDNTPATQMMWREIFKTEYSEFNGALILKYCYFDGSVAFLMPLGENIKEAVLEIDSWCLQNSVPFKLCFATQEQTELVKELLEVSVKEEEIWADYIYNTRDLAEMTGKKYNGQRNHINAFKRINQNYSFEPLTSKTVKDAEAFFTEYNSNTDKDSELFFAEQRMVYEALDNLDVYKMEGICLYVNGKMVGFTAGEVVGDTLYVHIEKANTEVRGAYQMLVKEFALMHRNKAEFINREEDMGDEGLKKSKLSYQPTKLIYKYTIEKE